MIPPPQTIKTNDCFKVKKGTEYINQPHILPVVALLDKEASKYEAKSYNPEGFSIEKLQELNDLHDDIENRHEEVD